MRIQGDTELRERMLDALAERRRSAEPSAAAASPGKIILRKRSTDVDLWSMPPVGSAAFDERMVQSEVDGIEAIPESVPITPRMLGFAEANAEPPLTEAYEHLERILSGLEQELSLRRSSVPRWISWLSSFWIRLKTPVGDLPEWVVMTNKGYSLQQAEAWQGDTQTLQLQSFLSGRTVYLRLAVNGKVAIRDEVSQSDTNVSVQRLANAISTQTDTGVFAVHALRRASAGFECWKFPRSLPSVHANTPGHL